MVDIDQMKKRRDEFVQEFLANQKELEVLLKDERVQRYMTQSKRQEQLWKELSELKLEIQNYEWSHCNHIWITSEIVQKPYGRERDMTHMFCVKCGLDTRAVTRANNPDLYFVSPIAWAMSNILHGKYYSYQGIRTDIVCSQELAQGIYRGLLRAHPNMQDEQVVLYLEEALFHIREKKVTEGVQKKRIKRLGLAQNFDEWQASDVIRKN